MKICIKKCNNINEGNITVERNKLQEFKVEVEKEEQYFEKIKIKPEHKRKSKKK